MKNKLLLFSSLITLTSFSQVSLTKNDIAPTVGYQVTQKRAEYINPGNSGANQTWDFSSLSSGAALQFSYTAPIDTVLGSTITYNSDEIIASLRLSGDTIFEILSLETADGFIALNFIDQQTINKYPMNYLDSYTDDFYGIIDIQGSFTPRNGTTNITIDGYGTLITPSGTFTDCLRRYEEQIYFDSIGGGVAIATTQRVYTWFKAGYQSELMSIVYIDNGSGITEYSQYYFTSNVGIEESNPVDFSVYPNPVNDNLSVEAENGNLESYSIFDIQGKEVQSGQFGLLSGNNISVSELLQGTYFIVVNSDKASQKRFVKI